jgi:hypothetical protein
MCRLVYWIGIVFAAIGTAGAIWLLDPSKVLFPGLLTLFSFSLIWTTQDSRLTRENPKILVHRGSTGLLSSACTFVACVSNPGVLAGTLTRIDYRSKGESVPDVRWSWQSLHPELTPRSHSIPRSSPPIPLLPGGLIALFTETKIDPVPEDAYLQLTFRMGGYKERTIKWRVEPLKLEVVAGENKDETR